MWNVKNRSKVQCQCDILRSQLPIICNIDHSVSGEEWSIFSPKLRKVPVTIEADHNDRCCSGFAKDFVRVGGILRRQRVKMDRGSEERKALARSRIASVRKLKVDSSGVSPDGVSNEERKREARHLIQSGLAFHVKSNRDLRECWIYLQNRFAPNTNARKYEFYSCLFDMQMEGEKVEEFNRFEDCLWHLEDMVMDIPEWLLVARIIYVLPRSWHIGQQKFWQEFDTLTRDTLYRKMSDFEWALSHEISAQAWFQCA